MLRAVRNLWDDETGLVTVEYALLLALVALVAIVGWRHLGRHVRRTVRRGAVAALPY
jgi:Flp pilus assembly pilin Flp